MSSKNPLGDRGKASEDAWIREQERLAREKAKSETNVGEKKKGCSCKKSGGVGDCACKKSGGSCGA
ncbi:MAG: hypothetical protein SGJ27_31420 [Candidatus Melainabacteria bacterium]|nr:hypothetical protein [Candidatus Melainabacteria bacterium]